MPVVQESVQCLERLFFLFLSIFTDGTSQDFLPIIAKMQFQNLSFIEVEYLLQFNDIVTLGTDITCFLKKIGYSSSISPVAGSTLQ